MKTKTKRGRPVLEVKRDKWLPVRVSVDDIDEVRAKAEKAKMGLSAWVRNRLGLEPTNYEQVR